MKCSPMVVVTLHRVEQLLLRKWGTLPRPSNKEVTSLIPHCSSLTRRSSKSREILTKGERKRFLVGGVYEDRWTPLLSDRREGPALCSFFMGCKKGKENVVAFAKEHGAKVNNDLLCTTASMQDRKLFREIFSQMGEDYVEYSLYRGQPPLLPISHRRLPR